MTALSYHFRLTEAQKQALIQLHRVGDALAWHCQHTTHHAFPALSQAWHELRSVLHPALRAWQPLADHHSSCKATVQQEVRYE